MIKAKVIVSGEIQGIGYRDFVKRNARKLGLNGYVRNLDYDKVEVVIEGQKSEVEQLLEIMKEHPIAVIKDFNVRFEESRNEFKEFSIKY